MQCTRHSSLYWQPTASWKPSARASQWHDRPSDGFHYEASTAPVHTKKIVFMVSIKRRPTIVAQRWELKFHALHFLYKKHTF
jgi:hypothetical protein